MFPIFLNLAGRRCVVVGGGYVARRKAATLLESGARVRLVCLEPQPPDLLDERLEWLTEAYSAAHLEGASLVIAAATPDVNRQVAADARARGIWVNAASEPEQGDFFMPAVLRRGSLTVAVGTGGEAPALARALRDLIGERLDGTVDKWLTLLAEFRPLVHARTQDAHKRQAILERLCEPGWLERLRLQPVEEVRAAMHALVRASRLSAEGKSQ